MILSGRRVAKALSFAMLFYRTAGNHLLSSALESNNMYYHLPSYHAALTCCVLCFLQIYYDHTSFCSRLVHTPSACLLYFSTLCHTSYISFLPPQSISLSGNSTRTYLHLCPSFLALVILFAIVTGLTPSIFPSSFLVSATAKGSSYLSLVTSINKYFVLFTSFYTRYFYNSFTVIVSPHTGQ